MPMLLPAWEIFHCKGILSAKILPRQFDLNSIRKIIVSTSRFTETISTMKFSRFVSDKTSISREVREAAKGCKQGGENCRGELRQEKKKNRTTRRRVNKSKTKKSKMEAQKGGNVEKKNSTRKFKRNKKQRQQPKETKKLPKKKSRKDLRKETKWFEATTTPTKILRQGQCFTDIVAKSKKFNKAQVEFRLANRIDR